MKRDLSIARLSAASVSGNRLARIVGIVMLAAAACVATIPTHADVTFASSVTNANGTLNTTLTWNSPGASGCLASGHAAWSGAKPATGTLALPPISLSGTYTLTLSCTKPGNAATTVSWTLPTTNTDGSVLTNLAGIRVNWGRTVDTMTNVKLTGSPTLTSTNLGNLAEGDWYFTARAYNTAGIESDNLTPIKKTIVATAVENGSVTLTVNPIPNPPTDFH